MMKRSNALSVGLLLSLALVGCTPGVAVDAPPSAPPTPRQSADAPTAPNTPEPPAIGSSSEPERVVITAETMHVILHDGTLAESFTYFEPIEEVVAGLTAVFGAEPVVTRYPDTPSVDYEWDGFRIGTDGRGQPPADAESIVLVSAPAVHGVSIETVDGIRVGDPAGPLETAHPGESHRWMYNDVERLSISVGSVSVAAGEEREFSVQLTAHPAEGVVTDFMAPHKNFE